MCRYILKAFPQSYTTRTVMDDYVVPLVCGILWITTWFVGYCCYRCGTQFSRQLVMQPEGWPLSNTAAFVELLSFAAAMAAFLEVKHTHDKTPVRYFDAVVGLNIAVYALLFTFIFVFGFEIMRFVTKRSKKLWATMAVIGSYVSCQLALVVLYSLFLERFQQSIPLVLSLFVLFQKGLDVYWVLLRRRAFRA